MGKFNVNPPYDEGALPDIRHWFEQNYTIQFANYPVDANYLSHGATVVGGLCDFDSDP